MEKVAPVRYAAMVEARERVASQFYVPTGRVVVLVQRLTAKKAD
jgi:hypothetical protein